MHRLSAILVVVTAMSCGGGEVDVYEQSPDEGPTMADDMGSASDVATTDESDAGTTADMSAPDAPPPRDLEPCATADCWDTSISAPPCAVATHDEDYSSGNYNVHAYGSVLWDDIPTRVRVENTGGGWSPVLVVVDGDGTVLFDGERGLQRPGLEVGVMGPADVEIRSDATLAVTIFVTAEAVVASDFSSRIDTAATYTLSVESDCGGGTVTCTVNGNDVRQPACGWLHYTARRVVPYLSGTRSDRIEEAAIVAWWSLKEGVMFLDNPIVYSNCNFPDGDARIGPLESCVPDRAWQVGLSAVQVPWHTDAEVEGVAGTLLPDLTIDEILASTAREAGLDEASVDAVVQSSGELRKSWLLRNSVIGFAVEAPVVRSECIDDSLRWCYGTGWDSTRMYAPDRAGAMQSIADIEALFDANAP